MVSTRELDAEGFESRLLTVVLTAAAEQRAKARSMPRRSPRKLSRVAAVAAAALTLTTVGLVAESLQTDPLRSGALAVERGSDVTSIRLVDAATRPSDIERGLRAAGLDVVVMAEPVTPEAEGLWRSVLFEDQVPEAVIDDIERQLVGGAGAEVLRLPNAYQGTITLTVGRPAARGELYLNTGTNLLAPGQPLHCAGLHDLAPAAARDVFAGLGYEVQWVRETAVEAQEVDQPPPGQIVWAYPRSPGIINVRVAPPGEPIDPQLRWRDYPASAAATGSWDYRTSCDNTVAGAGNSSVTGTDGKGQPAD